MTIIINTTSKTKEIIEDVIRCTVIQHGKEYNFTSSDVVIINEDDVAAIEIVKNNKVKA